VQKIETVGKTYMAAAGIRQCEESLSTQLQAKDKQQRMILFALQIEKTARNYVYDERQGLSFRLKVGIHKGPVIAGVIGHKPQFSLIGNTVNTTSRICSLANEGKVTISDQLIHFASSYTKLYLRRESILPKGLRCMQVWEVTTRFPDSYLKYARLLRRLVERLRKNPALPAELLKGSWAQMPSQQESRLKE